MYLRVQSHREAQAAKRLLRNQSKNQGVIPHVMITNKLASYGGAKREIMLSVEHLSHVSLNSRPENIHQSIRRRERLVRCFKSAGRTQRLLSVYDQVVNIFLHPVSSNADDRRGARAQILQAWAEVTGVASIACF